MLAVEKNLFNIDDSFCSETELYQKREEVWQQIEGLARKNNPNFEELINRVNLMSLSSSDNGTNNNNDMNEDDYGNEQYSKDVSRSLH